MVEVVEAEDTSEETVQAAVDFCSRIGKQPLRCLDGPGFAVGRVLGALLSEAWRVEHEGMDAAEVDERVEAAGLLPSGPFRLAERLGPRTLLRAGEHLRDALDPRFYVSPALERLGAGRRMMPSGVPYAGEPAQGAALRVSLLAGTPAEPAQRASSDTLLAARGACPMSPEGALDPLAERLRLRALVEACLVVEEGVAGVRRWTRVWPGRRACPPARSPGPTATGSTAYSPPCTGPRSAGARASALRPAPAPGGSGAAGLRVGAGVLPLPAARSGVAYGRRAEGDAWPRDRGLARLPAGQPLSEGLVNEFRTLWDAVDGQARVLVVASATLDLLRRRGHQGFTQMDAETGAAYIDDVHKLMRPMERSSTITIAAVGRLALGGGCELALACDLRIAGEGASFGQPEISGGSSPASAAPSGCRAWWAPRALEMCLTGTPVGAYEALRIGLANRVVPDHELWDTAPSWARGWPSARR